ncbi:hemagglutinin repeat-containing protein [Aggregatibacter kilianii]|uniref:hemagglutinin repeat-containing protein n=1 Tax=Aggregatibacter kilianii TaxID=2025884 RepID=UPI001FB24D66|nr:hemagglutinin repeat-containing protein [Aggregatibacter kilianii]
MGEAVISETERFFGYNRTRMNQDGESTNQRGSNLTSLNSVVSVYAGKDYHQTASEVLAKEKADISAQHITIDNAINHQANSQSESDLKIGQFTRVKSPIIDLLNTIESAVKNDRASDRLQAANAMSMAAQGYSVYNAVNKMITKDPKSNTYLFRVESGTGVAHSRQSQEGLADISVGSRINAKDINLIARGDDKQKANEKGERQLGSINLTHTDLTSRDEQGKRIQDSRITLTGNKLNIQAGENHTQFKGRSQSVGVEVGMAAQVGAQTGVGVYARVGGSSGKEDGESKTYQVSHLEAQTVTLNSQGDTNLIGSQVAGNRVNANVGGKLNIESLQDEERFKTKSSGGGLEVEFGFGNNWSVSSYGNASKGTTYRKQVNEQAGIFAEEGGDHINADSVHLKGGAIASTNPTNSKLATNKLTFEDIQNESSSSAASASISGSIKESKEKWVDNETGEKVKPNSPNSTFIPSQRSGGLSPGLPMLQQSSDSSTTKATLTEGTIILNKDTSPTQTTAAQLGINTDLAQANNQVAQTKDVKAQLQEQQQIATAINNVKSAVETYTANQQEAAEQEVRRLKSRLEKAEQQGNKEVVNQLKKDILQAEIQAENWGTGGSTKRAVDAITHAGLIALSGGSSQSIAMAATSPYVNQLIKKATEDYPALNIPTHILWGAVEAELMGGKASTGAISTAAGELGAKYLTEHLYNKKAKLTETERSQVKEMAKALAGVAGSLAAAGQGASAVKILSESSIGMTVANNAVENNYLTANEAARKAELLMLIQRENDPEKKAKYQEELDSLVAKDIRTQKEIEDNCPKFGKNSSACQASIQDAEKARRSYNASTDKYQPVGYTQDKRQYKNVFSNDYARTNEALAGKDSLTIQKEAFAIDVAKSKNTSPEQEYNWISNGIDLGWLGEFQGWGRAIKGLPKGSNANEKLPIVGETTNYSTTRVIINDKNVWSSTKKLTPQENAIIHWNKHKDEFPELKTYGEYINMVHTFINNPPKGTEVKVRGNGDKLFYHQESNVFVAINKDGIPKTMFKPIDKKEYFDAQK